MNYIQSLLSDIPGLIIHFIIVIFALTIHEVAHGYAAYKLGDPTARAFGRLSLNPLRHLDPIGFLCMLFFRFGWARPVPINTRYFKKPRRDMAISALAGPLSNILLSFAALLICRIYLAILVPNLAVLDTDFKYNLAMLVLSFFTEFASLNLYLGMFNLIPVPPLDGSRILFVVLPDKYYFGIMKYERYIQLALILLLYTGLITGPLSAVCTYVFNGMDLIISLIPGL